MSYLENNLKEYAITNDICTHASIAVWSQDYKTKDFTDDIYDLASLTKTITGYIVVKYLNENSIKLTDCIGNYLNAKTDISFLNLLTHNSGLKDSDFKNVNTVCKDLNNKYCTGIVNYADINYILLFKVIDEMTDAKKLVEDFFIKNNLDVTYHPIKKFCVENQKRENRITKGIVHDTKCYNLGGVSYNAGLFSNCEMLIKFYKIILDDSDFLEQCILYQNRTLCFIKKSDSYYLGDDVLFHTGYTGGSILIDLKLKSIIVILTNRTYILDFKYEVIKDFRNYAHKLIYKDLL